MKELLSLEEKKNALAKTCIFRGVDDQSLEELALHCVEKTYKKGRILFSEGDLITQIYIVKSGSLKLMKETPEGEESILELVLPHGVVGDLECLTMNTYPFSAQALEVSKILSLNTDLFVLFTRKHQSMYLESLRCSNLRFLALSTFYRDLMKEEVIVRLARLLYIFSRSISNGKIHAQFKVPSSQILGDLIGCKRETVLRMLSQLRKSEVIKQSGSIVELDEKKLMASYGPVDLRGSCIICSGFKSPSF